MAGAFNFELKIRISGVLNGNTLLKFFGAVIFRNTAALA